MFNMHFDPRIIGKLLYNECNQEKTLSLQGFLWLSRISL